MGWPIRHWLCVGTPSHPHRRIGNQLHGAGSLRPSLKRKGPCRETGLHLLYKDLGSKIPLATPCQLACVGQWSFRLQATMHTWMRQWACQNTSHR